MKRMNPRERKIVAIGILVAILAGAWLAVVNPIRLGFVAREAERRALIATYQRNQRLLGGIPLWRTDADLQRRTGTRYAIAAPSPSRAAELLRERVGRVIAQQGGTLRSVQDQAADARPGWVRVRADASLSINQLHEALRRLQLEEPNVVVEYISVAAGRAGQSGLTPAIDVRLEVSARFRAAKTA